MKQYTFLFIAIVMLIAALINGCTDSAPTGPVIGLGNSTVTKYVSVGNSLTAGYQSAGLYKSAQLYSYPNLIAQQLTKAGATIGTFQQPYWPDPGIPDPTTGKASRYIIYGWSGTTPLIGPIGEALTAGAPENAGTVLRPYDNLGIPGIPLAGFMDTTGIFQSPPLGRDAILRWTSNALLGNSVFKQVATLKAMGQTPDLVTFWLGANDVLGFAITGGTSPSTPTDPTIFNALYGQALDALRNTLPNAKIVVGNIPNVTSIPFFTTVNPLLASHIPAPYYLRYQKHGVTGMSFDSTKLTEANPPLITLKGQAYAALLGTSTGQFWRDAAASLGVPLSTVLVAQGVYLDTTKPFGFHPQNPWPDALILDADEIASATNAVNNFNSSIATIAASHGAVVVDFNRFFNNIKVNGFVAYGETYTAAYISGDIFSLDGIHPSDRGYGIVANEYIKVINASFGMNIPLVDLNSLPKLSAPLAKSGNGKIDPLLPFGAFNSLDLLFRPSVQ
jgi:lysophospholipase L1-like esterase